MTEKRYSYDSKQVAILKDGEFWLEGQISTACNHSEICNELNQLNDENEQLKESNERFSKTVAEQIIMIKEYREENEQLKEELYQQEVSEQRRREYDDFWKEKINKVKKNDK